MIRWGLFVLFLLLVGCVQNSEGKTDLANVKSSNDSIQIWANTAKNNTHLSWDERHALATKAYQQNSSVNEKSKKVKNLSRISLAYSNLGDSLNFRKTNKELIQLAKDVADKVAHGEAHWDLGSYFRNTKPDSSYYHFKEAYTLFKKVNFKNTGLEEKASYPGQMLLAMASRRDDVKDYIGAEKDAIAAIEEFNKIGANNRLYDGYNALASAQSGLNKFKKALEYYLKAQEYISFKRREKRLYLYLQNKNNIAAIFLREKDFERAFRLYQELENDIQEEEEGKGLLFRKIYSSIAISGFNSRNLSASEALNLIEKSKIALDSMGNTYDLARNKQYAAEILRAEKDFEGAIDLAKQAKQLAESTGNNDRLLEILKLLSQIDEKNGAQYAKAYFDLNEQLQLQERAIQDKFARIQMETDEIIEENESLAKRTELLAGISVGLLVLGIGIFTIISQRISNQRLKFKQKQQENNQEIYNLMLAQHGKMEEGKKSEQKRVSEELHDGILGQMLGIRLVLSGLNERNDPSAVEQRAELIVKLQELEEEIRTISHELNASAYEKVHNFILSIQDLVDTVEKSAKISIALQYDEQFEWDSLHSDIKINSYRVIQELLQNCVKHSQCTQVQVALLNDKNLLNLSIEDDGIGFDNSKTKKGIGLKNIISRVKKMGAQLEIKSEPSKGTKVMVTIPNIDLKKQHPKPSNARNTVLEA